MNRVLRKWKLAIEWSVMQRVNKLTGVRVLPPQDVRPNYPDPTFPFLLEVRTRLDEGMLIWTQSIYGSAPLCVRGKSLRALKLYVWRMGLRRNSSVLRMTVVNTNTDETISLSSV